MSKEEQIEALSQRLSDVSIIIDETLHALKEHGLEKHEFAFKLEKTAEENEKLLIKLQE